MGIRFKVLSNHRQFFYNPNHTKNYQNLINLAQNMFNIREKPQYPKILNFAYRSSINIRKYKCKPHLFPSHPLFQPDRLIIFLLLYQKLKYEAFGSKSRNHQSNFYQFIQILKQSHILIKINMQSNSNVQSKPLPPQQTNANTASNPLFGAYQTNVQQPGPFQFPQQINQSPNVNPGSSIFGQYPSAQMNISNSYVPQVQTPYQQQFPVQQQIYPHFPPIPQQLLYTLPQQQQLVMPSSPYANIFGGFGSSNLRSQVESLKMISFADDQLIQAGKKTFVSTEDYGESKIEFKVISEHPQAKIGLKQSLPCVCSIKGNGGARASVDIVCVIDISGSMCGQKIDLVRDTMKYVVEMLTPNDRLSIMVYNNDGTRLCPFMFVNNTNIPKLTDIISKLNAGGGNIMLNGLEVAVKILRERRTINDVTSIFLLSDGQEPHETESQFKEMLKEKVNENLGSFSLHSFGFGSDHDENLMTKICSIKDGNFYFINQLSSLDEAFCNALGGIITQTASDIKITVESIAAGPVDEVQIKKVYGQKWKKINEKIYKIEINQIMSQVSKDFVFEIELPSVQFQASDANRSLPLIKANYTAKNNHGKQISGEAFLVLEFIDLASKLSQEANPEVAEAYYRLKVVEVVEESIKQAEKGQYDIAKKQIEDLLETIKYHQTIRKEKVKGLIADLQLAKQKCSPQVFQNHGRKEMMNIWHANSNQTSFQYSNTCQQQMLFGLQAKKM